MSEQLSLNDNKHEVVSTPLRIWRMSQTAIDDWGQRELLMQDNFVAINGRDGYNQGDVFRKEIRKGDFFYLLDYSKENGKKVKKIQLFGYFDTDEVISCSSILPDWIKRHYIKLSSASPGFSYQGPNTGWAPGANNTVFLVYNGDRTDGKDELKQFEESILKPCFNKTLLELSRIKKLMESDEHPDNVNSNNNRPGYNYELSKALISAKNIILRGAPGTGKTYLAWQIAADIVSNGTFADYDKLSTKQKEQIEFVQFHPSYDYTDFVEGLRPDKKDGSLGFELKYGVFVNFVKRAIEHNQSFEKLTGADLLVFLQEMADNKTEMSTTHNTFCITRIDDGRIYPATIDEAGNVFELGEYPHLKIDRLLKCLPYFEKIHSASDIYFYLGEERQRGEDGYVLSILQYIKELTRRNYVFIIDEINRGEISKIFGELFFSIDPGYRGLAGGVKTQYANLHDDENEKFYIPDNVYIIGTMNDIDRSVDSFDFAMRRRFRFVEIKVIEEDSDNQSKKDDNQKLYKISRNTDIILDSLKDKDNRSKVEERIINLNKAISNTPGLNANYHIGAAYFLKLNDDGVNFNVLWDDYLEPLLQEYVRGMSDEETNMKAFKDAYNAAAPQTNHASESDKKEAEPAGESKENASSAQATIQEEAVQHDDVK